MRKVFKVVAITAFILEYVLLVGLFSLVGIANYRNRSKYATDSLYVSVKADYKDKFLNQEFSPEDFGENYVEYIGYRSWVDGNPDEGKTGHGVVYVKLKTNDWFHYKKAVRSFESLSFVMKTEKNWILHV